jgi:hypothetical protein
MVFDLTVFDLLVFKTEELGGCPGLENHWHGFRLIEHQAIFLQIKRQARLHGHRTVSRSADLTATIYHAQTQDLPQILHPGAQGFLQMVEVFGGEPESIKDTKLSWSHNVLTLLISGLSEPILANHIGDAEGPRCLGADFQHDSVPIGFCSGQVQRLRLSPGINPLAYRSSSCWCTGYRQLYGGGLIITPWQINHPQQGDDRRHGSCTKQAFPDLATPVDVEGIATDWQRLLVPLWYYLEAKMALTTHAFDDDPIPAACLQLYWRGKFCERPWL